jgi:hypothetical protein
VFFAQGLTLQQYVQLAAECSGHSDFGFDVMVLSKSRSALSLGFVIIHVFAYEWVNYNFGNYKLGIGRRAHEDGDEKFKFGSNICLERKSCPLTRILLRRA